MSSLQMVIIFDITTRESESLSAVKQNDNDDLGE